MHRIFWLAIALVFGVVGHAAAAPIHPMTWVPRSAAPGDTVTIAGQPFELVRLPLRDLGGSNRYFVSFLRLVTEGFFTAFVVLTTTHSNDPIENPIQIDGFDATVEVTDRRSYNLNSPDGGNHSFVVFVHVDCVVKVKIGQTLALISTSFFAEQQPVTDIGTIPNAVPFAQWGDYLHPTTLVNGCDRWLDYIRIRPVN
jgi:hypothetical protein